MQDHSGLVSNVLLPSWSVQAEDAKKAEEKKDEPKEDDDDEVSELFLTAAVTGP
jgi:hypothetical protein